MKNARRRTSAWIAAVAMLAGFGAPQALRALDVDMDPVPRIPLRPGEEQYFLIYLSGAKAKASGTVSFKDLGPGLSAEPAEREFSVAPGESSLLAFKIKNAQWGEPATIRPVVTAGAGETVNFPEILKTEIFREQKILDKKPLDDKGLLLYCSCGDGEKYRGGQSFFYDRCVGLRLAWAEGCWIAAGGVKGQCLRGANGDMKTKLAFSPMNNVDHRAGTIAFWLRKEERVEEIPYQQGSDMSYDATWQYGPVIGRSRQGEGIFGANFTPQTVCQRRIKAWKPKAGSDTFISLRRYKALDGKPGYLEATYVALRQRRYTVRAPYDWTAGWRHVAVAWDMEKKLLAIHLDGKLASDALRGNGKPESDAVWYGAPWHNGFEDQACFGIVCHPDEGGRNATRRDEFYVYNHPLSDEELRENMRASMGAAPAPSLDPPGGPFHGTLSVRVGNLWSNPVHRYTLDGSEPSENSPLCNGAIALDKDATVKVRAFLEGFTPSPVTEGVYQNKGPDTAKPKVCDVLAVNDPRTILVSFDKKVDPASAADPKNYTIAGAPVEGAVLDRDGQVVRLKTAKPLGAEALQLSVKNVKDTAPGANVMDPADDLKVELKHAPGLVGWWRFDVLGGPVLKNFASNKMDGTAYHDTSIPRAEYVEGYKGQALYLKSAGDFADLSEYASGALESTNLDDKRVDPASAFNVDNGSVFMWIKAPPVEKRRSRSILAKTYAYDIGLSGNALTCSGNSWKFPVNEVIVADGKWHHIGLTFQNKVENGSKLYVDGEQKSVTTAKFLGHAGMRLQLSRPTGWGGYDCPYDGAIDEVMFFSRVLSDAEAAALFKTGFLTAPGEGK